MAYKKAREEQKWKQWKEKEEVLLREFGMDEESIQELRSSDWEDFKAERCLCGSPVLMSKQKLEGKQKNIFRITASGILGAGLLVGWLATGTHGLSTAKQNVSNNLENKTVDCQKMKILWQ